MARQTKTQLSASFVDGKLISGSMFGDIFDSTVILDDTGTRVISGSISLLGNLSAERLLVSASVVYGSGSTIFGDSGSDFHAFTGSISQTGSNVDFTGGTGVSGSFSGSYQGDGGDLTGPFSGSFSGSYQGDGSSLTGLPGGGASESTVNAISWFLA